MLVGLKILNENYFKDYNSKLTIDVELMYETLKNKHQSTEDFM